MSAREVSTGSFDEFIKRNGICPLDEREKDDYKTGLGYFAEGWDAHAEQAAAEYAALVDQNQRFIEWHLEQGKMLTALRAELERWVFLAENRANEIDKLRAELEEKKKAIDVIESIALEDGGLGAVTEIYKIAHIFAGHCQNKHDDWRKEFEKYAPRVEKGDH